MYTHRGWGGGGGGQEVEARAGRRPYDVSGGVVVVGENIELYAVLALSM